MERRADFPQILVSAAAHRRPRGRVPVPFQFMRDARLSMGARLPYMGVNGGNAISQTSEILVLKIRGRAGDRSVWDVHDAFSFS